MVPPITKVDGVKVVRTRPNRYGSQGAYFEDIKGPGWTQALPYDRPLAYQRHTRKLQVIVNQDNNWVCTLRTMSVTSAQHNLVYSRVRAKFVEQCLQGERAELGINLATASMTAKLFNSSLKGVALMGKISDVATKLDRFARTLRKAVHEQKPSKRQRWRNKAASILGCSPTSQKEVDYILRKQYMRVGSSVFAAEYLAFHFGWSPLIKDISTILTQLQEGYRLSPATVRVRSRIPTPLNNRSDPVWLTGNGKYSIELGAEASVGNESLFVLNRLGLINPATVLWDKVPFSFVADWFGNFSQMFAAPTDFLGVVLKNCYQTTYHDYKINDLIVSKTLPARLMVTKGVSMVRTVISRPPVPRFYAKVPFGTSWRRSLAQISLLTLFGLGKTTTNR